MCRARIEVAEQSDAVADLRGAELARLELLQESLAEVYAQIPPDVDLFDSGLVPSAPPRLFVDMLGFVEMARDRRTYRFLRDTRHGRVTLVESDDVERVAAEITTYVARRLVERERALAADSLPLPRPRRPDRTIPVPDEPPAPPQPAAPAPRPGVAGRLADGSLLRMATNALALVLVVILILAMIVIATREWLAYG